MRLLPSLRYSQVRKFLHLEPFLDALTLRSDVIISMKILFIYDGRVGIIMAAVLASMQAFFFQNLLVSAGSSRGGEDLFMSVVPL